MSDADELRDSVARLKAIEERNNLDSDPPESDAGDRPTWPEEPGSITQVPESVGPSKAVVAMTLALPPSQRAKVYISLAAMLTLVIITLALADRIPGWLAWLISKVLPTAP